MTHPAEKDAVLAVLRAHWPESGGQSGHREALATQDACADAILRIIPPVRCFREWPDANSVRVHICIGTGEHECYCGVCGPRVTPSERSSPPLDRCTYTP